MWARGHLRRTPPPRRPGSGGSRPEFGSILPAGRSMSALFRLPRCSLPIARASLCCSMAGASRGYRLSTARPARCSKHFHSTRRFWGWRSAPMAPRSLRLGVTAMSSTVTPGAATAPHWPIALFSLRAVRRTTAADIPQDSPLPPTGRRCTWRKISGTQSRSSTSRRDAFASASRPSGTLMPSR